jgi:anti-sigma-K factor RskA
VSAHDDEHLREDAAAWLLGALGDEEAQDFEQRLEHSAAARAEVEALREAADALPYAVEPVGPPPELRDRIMAIVESEAELLHATAATADRPPPPQRRRWSWLRPAPLAAAACALVLAGVVAGVLIAGSGSEPARTVAAQVSGAGMPDARGRLEIADGKAELVVDGMGAAPSGHVYQVWVLHEGETEPVPGALFDVDRDGHGTTALPDVDDVTTVMVSVEPEGGSEHPTTDPVLEASLS